MDDESGISHKDIYDQVEANSKAITNISAKLDRMRSEDDPVRAFVADFDAAARIGRGLRSLIGWVVVVGGFFAMIWIVVVDAIR